ncbi:MAG: hypothetical protein R3F14_37390 [Polyangiaceae bacterium]
MRSCTPGARRPQPHSARAALAACLLATATLLAACDDGGSSTTSSGGSAGAGGTTTSNGGTGGTTTATGGKGGTGGTGGTTSNGGNGGTTSNGGNGGVAGNGGNGGNGGVAGNGGNGGVAGNGGNGNGGSGGVAGSGGNGNGGSGNGGSGNGGNGSSQPDNWGAPPMVAMPALPSPPDYSAYPTDSEGRPIVSQGPNVNWVVPIVPDAMSAREKCADLVANCYQPGVRSLDACMLSAPACTTNEPWTEAEPCCATACFTAYSNLRKAKVDPLTAYQKVLYDTPVCMPGVDAMLSGGAP